MTTKPRYLLQIFVLSLAGFSLLNQAAFTFPAYADDPNANPLPSWNYNGGANDDEDWGEISPDFASCTLGNNQSPIMISYTTLADLPRLSFDYRNTEAQMAWQDHTLVINTKNVSTLTIGKLDYRLTQIRFHTPSEHPLRDKNFPMEIHLIHRDEHNQLLIVAVLVQLGEANPVIDSILAPIVHNDVAQHTESKNVFLKLPALLPPSLGYFSYTGSLTWPPCTEGVEWRILKEPIEISMEQFQSMAKLIRRNARLPQPVYMRTVLESKD